MNKCLVCDSELKISPIRVMLYEKYVSCPKCKNKMIYDVPKSFIRYLLMSFTIIPSLLFIAGAIVSSSIIIGLGVFALILDLYVQFLNSKLLAINKENPSKTRKRKTLAWIIILLTFLYLISDEIEKVRKKIFRKADVIAEFQND